MNSKIALILVILSLVLVACNPTGAFSADKCLTQKDSAKDDCYLQEKKCSKIKSDEVRDSCVTELAKAKDDVKVCDLVKNDKAADFCVHEIAVEQDNHDLCKEIDSQYWKDNCNFNLAVNNNKDIYCSLISVEKQKADCFYDIAQATQDTMLCEFLEGKNRERCVYFIAQNKKDITICNEVPSSLGRDACKLKLSKITNKFENCDKIKIKDVKMLCYEHFGEKYVETHIINPYDKTIIVE